MNETAVHRRGVMTDDTVTQTRTPIAPTTESVVSVTGLHKTYDTGFTALRDVNLSIRRGEIFALLGPNGAGKTTLIGIICGLVNASAGQVLAGGHDVVREYRAAREKVGLVPQELTTDAFETVWATTNFSRRLFGKPPDDAHIERVLRSLVLWDKRNTQIRKLSGGMKRRLLIAKALAHEPEILFLDEPTAGVDVELRRGMWDVVQDLRATGVTIILTTHYIEEAEHMADRVGVIQDGEILLVEDKSALMHKLGEKRLTIQLAEPLQQVPQALAGYELALSDDGSELIHTYHPQQGGNGVPGLMQALNDAGVAYVDLYTQQSSLEEIFVNLVEQ